MQRNSQQHVNTGSCAVFPLISCALTGTWSLRIFWLKTWRQHRTFKINWTATPTGRLDNTTRAICFSPVVFVCLKTVCLAVGGILSFRETPEQLCGFSLKDRPKYANWSETLQNVQL